MALIMYLVGIVLGMIAGLILAAWSDWRTYRDAINVGFIKLNGRVFSLTEFDE